MSFARSDVRKDNSFRNAKAPLLQKIFHLLSTTAIFCLLSVARVWPGVYRPRAVLAPASRLGARLPSTRLFASREPVTPWREAPRCPSLRARTPFWDPRARRSLACGASVAISAGSQICGYEVCRAGGGGARGAEPASGWRRDVFSSLGGPRFALRLPVRSETDRTGHQSPLRLNDTKTRIFSTLAWKRINKKNSEAGIVCRPSAIILRAHTLESPFLKKKVLRNEENT